MCKYLSGKGLTDEELIIALGNGINVYYNYTGQAKCFNTSQQATGNLGDQGWGFQVTVHLFGRRLDVRCNLYLNEPEALMLGTVIFTGLHRNGDANVF